MNALFILSIGLIGCGDKEGDSGTDADTEIAEEIWGEIGDLQTWNQLSGWEGVVESSSVHGGSVQIWLNSLAYDALSNNGEVPDGGVIVKESFSDAAGAELKDYTVMKKISGYNADGADWFWAKFETDGSVATAGSPDMCTGCHSANADYLQFTNMEQPMTSLLISLMACTGESDWVPPGAGFGSEETNSETSTEPSGEPSGEPGDEHIDVDLDLGDPISTTSTFPQLNNGGGGSGGGPGIMYEWTDATVYNDQYAIQVGVSGASVVDRDSGEILHSAPNLNRAYRVDSDGETIIIGSRTDQVSFWTLSGYEMSLVYTIQPSGTHEDVAVDDDVVAITWRTDGLKLYQPDGALIKTISAEDAFTVDIFENTLVYTDKTDLIILDITDPASPTEMDRIELPSEGRDLAFNGDRIAVGMGGNGVITFVKDGESFAEQDRFIFDGAALSVALDGDHLWTATWNSVWLSWLGETKAIHLGQETPYFSAMGLDAEGGRAIIADWYHSTVMVQNEGVWGPEVSLPPERFFASDEEDTQVIPIPNYSSQELTVEFTTPQGFSMTETSISVEPGKTEYTRITSPTSNWHTMILEWTSNDPDELSGQIELKAANDGVGSPHEDFELPLVSAEGLLGNVRLSDYQGKVLFLAWWSDY